MRMNQNIKNITLMGFYLSLFFAIGLIPNVGLIYVPPVYLTTFPILMFIIIFVHQDFKFSLFAGFAFGITSLVMAAVRPMGSKDWLYLNPLISILPRILWSTLVYSLMLIGPKHFFRIPWLVITIFLTYWIHAFVSDIFKFIFYVWVGGYSWHNNDLLYSLGLIWAVEHLIEVAIYSSTIPFIYIKTVRVFKSVQFDKEIVVFDFSRTIAFGEGKNREIPNEFIDHLKNIQEKYQVIVITGRKYKKVEDELYKANIRACITSNGKNIMIHNISFMGYIGMNSRINSLKLVEKITHSKIRYIVSDNGNDLKLAKKWKMFRPEKAHKRLRNIEIHKWDINL